MATWPKSKTAQELEDRGIADKKVEAAKERFKEMVIDRYGERARFTISIGLSCLQPSACNRNNGFEGHYPQLFRGVPQEATFARNALMPALSLAVAQ